MKALEAKADTLLQAEGNQLAMYEPMPSRAHAVTMTLKQMEEDKALAQSVLKAEDFRLAVQRAIRTNANKEVELTKAWQSTLGEENVKRFLDFSPLHIQFQNQINAYPDRDTNVLALTATLHGRS